MKILVLDDDINRLKMFRQKFIGNDLKTVVDAQSAIALLKNERFDLVSLDHDLDGKQYVPSGPGTGYEVAEWLSKHPDRNPKQVVLHSLNGPARERMNAILPKAFQAPGYWLTDVFMP